MTGYLEELRPRLVEATGEDVRFLWFLRCDPQIESAYGSAGDLLQLRADLLGGLRAKGDRLGLHTHVWRWDDDTEMWVAAFDDPSWAEHCVRVGFDAFRARFGEDCTLHRFGDHWFSDAVGPLLQELGARFDLTLEPGIRERNAPPPGELMTGGVRDLASAPRQPSADDFLTADPDGETRLWLISLTSADPTPALPIVWRIARAIRSPGRVKHRPLSMYRAWTSPQAYWDLVECHVESLGRPYLAFAIRSGDPDAAENQRVRDVLDHLIGHPLARRLRFSDPAPEIGELTHA